MNTDDGGWGAALEEKPTSEPGDNAKAVLEGQVKDLWELMAEEAKLLDALEKVQKSIKSMKQSVIPQTLEDMGLEEVVVKGGLKVSIKTIIRASQGKADDVEHRNKIYDWFDNNGYGGMIKRKVVFNIGMGEEAREKADQLIADNEDKFPGEFERAIAPRSFTAFVAKEVEAGNKIPMDLFKVHVQREAQVKSG